MRLLVSDCEDSDVKLALAHLKVPNVTVKLNPAWLNPDPTETLWIACGAPAVKMVQAAGWIPKKGGVEALRGKLYSVQPDGWTTPINVGVTYAPQVRHIEFDKWVVFETEIAKYHRFEKTGTFAPKLGYYTYADTLAGVIKYLKAEHARTGGPVDLALDTETEGLNPFDPSKDIVCIQASAKPGISDVVYTLGERHTNTSDYNGSLPDGWLMSTRLAVIIEQLRWIAEQPWIRIVGANFKYDLLWIRRKWNVDLSARFNFDTCNGGSLLEENRPNTLNLHTKIYSPDLGGYDDDFNSTFDKGKMGAVPKESLLTYAGGDTDACLRNYYEIRKGLIADNPTPSGAPAKNSLPSLYVNVIQPTLRALHKMEYTGVMVDRERFHEFGADLQNRIAESTKGAAKLIPASILEKHGGLTPEGGAPLSKPKMIADYLFSPQGLNLKPTQTTEKTGAPSTSEYHLSQFKDHPEAGPLIEKFLDYKAVSKMHGTYYEGFLKHLRPDDRWHASYIIHKQGKDRDNEQDAGGTVTGRGSAVDPAFQCVTGDAEIMTPYGLRLARDLIDPVMDKHGKHNPFVAHACAVLTSKGYRYTSNVFRSWRSDLLRVKFRNGNEITCTPEHPIYMRNHKGRPHQDWVKARDLCIGDETVAVGKVTWRPEPPDWVTPEAAELLGLLSVAGKVAITLPYAYLEVPIEFAGFAEAALATVGIEADVTESVKTAVLRYDIGHTLPLTGAEFTSWLPDPEGEAIPMRLRTTKRVFDFLRGALRAKGRFSPKGTGFVTLTVPTRGLALALLRETHLEGLIPPTTNEVEKGYLVRWFGVAAGAIAGLCGFSTEGYPKPNPGRESRYVPSLQVESVEAAPPGYVYDFTVPDGHEFIANGLRVHNTVPKHSYWGKRLRECIIAPEGYRILARDYSQGELKVAACWAGESKMLEAYLSGVDLHVLTAATVNGMSYEEAQVMKKVDPAAFGALRQNGKAGNFGLLYGMQAYGFMIYADTVYGVKLTVEEAEAMRDAFFALYPGLPLWHDRQIMEAVTTGEVRSPMGRIRHLPNINSPIKAVAKKSRNQAINSPIQGTLVDMMWWSMGIIERERPELLVPCGQIHDQGLWYVHEDDIDEGLYYSREVMEGLPFEEKFGWKPELAFTSDAEIGCNLANLDVMVEKDGSWVTEKSLKAA